MTNDYDELAKEITNTIIVELEPFREMSGRLMTMTEDLIGIVQGLTARIEVLELELLSQKSGDAGKH